VHAPGVRLPTMLMLEPSAADGTHEGRFLAALYPDMILQGAAPEVSLTTLEADPRLPQVD